MRFVVSGDIRSTSLQSILSLAHGLAARLQRDVTVYDVMQCDVTLYDVTQRDVTAHLLLLLLVLVWVVCQSHLGHMTRRHLALGVGAGAA